MYSAGKRIMTEKKLSGMGQACSAINYDITGI